MIQMINKNHETAAETLSKNPKTVIELIPAAGYLRVSTENQAAEDKFGIPEQKGNIERYAKTNGFEIVKWYSDPGVSGALLDRPGLNEMLKDSKGKQFKAVIIAKMQVKRIIDRKEFYQGLYEYAGIKAEGKHQSMPK
jgi:hypothetical protein